MLEKKILHIYNIWEMQFQTQKNISEDALKNLLNNQNSEVSNIINSGVTDVVNSAVNTSTSTVSNVVTEQSCFKYYIFPLLGRL